MKHQCDCLREHQFTGQYQPISLCCHDGLVYFPLHAINELTQLMFSNKQFIANIRSNRIVRYRSFSVSEEHIVSAPNCSKVRDQTHVANSGSLSLNSSTLTYKTLICGSLDKKWLTFISRFFWNIFENHR